MRKLTLLAISLLLTCFVQEPIHAQDGTPKPAKLFSDDARLEVTLKGPWRRMARRPDSEERFEGEITYRDSNGKLNTHRIGITTRGLTRRTVCDFPPVKLWFNKDELKGTTFRGQGSLKMVTHCKASKGVEQYYIKEYLSYRIYNLITPYSFRVRSMSVTYQDSERSGAKPVERFGFLIEDIDDVAERNDLKELEIPSISHLKLDVDQTANYALFQYLISNLDWSATGGRDPVECCHNTKLIGASPDTEPVFPIPYDLDSSGLVDAHYAAPPAKLRINSVRTRLYRGFCSLNEALPAALSRYRAQRQSISRLFEEEPLLTPAGRKRAIKFIEEFFEQMDKPGALEKLTDKCRG
jgi:hypothetical protein